MCISLQCITAPPPSPSPSPSLIAAPQIPPPQQSRPPARPPSSGPRYVAVDHNYQGSKTKEGGEEEPHPRMPHNNHLHCHPQPPPPSPPLHGYSICNYVSIYMSVFVIA